MTTLWVIKIGTSLIRGGKEKTTSEVIVSFCQSVASCQDKGDRFILVSSGAVGLGCNQLGIKERPKDVVSLQAAAAVGQGYLMRLYELAMNKFGYKVGQVLLTRSDLASRGSYKNASLTLRRLLDWKVIPVINENDTLSDEELRWITIPASLRCKIDYLNNNDIHHIEEEYNDWIEMYVEE